MATSGYSGTPLIRKLGIKAGQKVALINSPPGYRKLLGELPGSVLIQRASATPRAGGLDLIHLFTKDRRELETLLPSLMTRIIPAGAIWVSWPKKSSGVATTISDNVVREVALPLGLVDVKVCAVDETWSALKLVIRLGKRQ